MVAIIAEPSIARLGCITRTIEREALKREYGVDFATILGFSDNGSNPVVNSEGTSSTYN
jgi:hypothetical protein